jgi:hypothetical protein
MTISSRIMMGFKFNVYYNMSFLRKSYHIDKPKIKYQLLEPLYMKGPNALHIIEKLIEPKLYLEPALKILYVIVTQLYQNSF